MSLINEALKKAQKQRVAEESAKAGVVQSPGAGDLSQGGKPPAPPPPKAPAGGERFEEEPERRPDPLMTARSRRSGGSWMRWALPAAGVVVVGAIGLWWSGGGDAEPPVTSGPQITAAPEPAAKLVPAPETKPLASQPEPVVESKPAEPAVSITPTPQPEQPATEPTPPVVAVREEAPMVQVATLATPPEPKPAVPAQRPAQPQPMSQPAAPATTSSTPSAGGELTILSDRETRQTVQATGASEAVVLSSSDAIVRYLERARVTGVRLSASDPKVLFNDRVYRLNEIVDRDLQLKLVGIAERELKFSDPRGQVYTKSF